jgi:hypothetical protein
VNFVTLMGKNHSTANDSRSLTCCQGQYVIFCRKAKINARTIGRPGAIVLPNITAEFGGPVAGTPNAFHYKTRDSSADMLITCSADRTRCFALASTKEKEMSTLEYCKGEGHVWKITHFDSIDVDDPEKQQPGLSLDLTKIL